MNCQIFETVVNDIAREQMMEANAREEALAHSVHCEACARKLFLERRLTFGLRALAAEMSSVSASARVEQQVLETFRSQISLFAKTPQVNRSRYWLVAAAAVVLIALGIVGMKLTLDRQSPPRIESSKTQAHTPAKTSIVAVDHPKPKPALKPTPSSYRPRRKEKRSSGSHETSVAKGRAEETTTTEAANAEETEVTTQFLPFSYASPVNLQDGGQLVRVEMPRSAMVRFGLPVNMERYGEKVKADVLVSADGLARAIRFVQ